MFFISCLRKKKKKKMSPHLFDIHALFDVKAKHVFYDANVFTDYAFTLPIHRRYLIRALKK